MLSILYPESDRIIRIPIDAWIKDLEKKYDEYIEKFQNRMEGWQDSLLVIINQAALISLYLGDKDSARNICNQAIYSFYQRFTSLNEKKSLNCIFQPWINIGRLDRVERDYDNAEKVFLSLNLELKYSYVLINGYHVPKDQIRDKEILSLLKNCYIYELIKTFIMSEKYDKCLEFIKKLSYENMQDLFYEANLISTVSMNGIQKGLDFSLSLLHNCSSRFKPILLLQISRIHLLNKNFVQSEEILKNLISEYSIYLDNMNYNGLRFCLEIINTAMKCFSQNFPIEFLKRILKKFEEIEDEPGVIECYFILKKLDTSNNNYTELFNENIKKTRYFWIADKYTKEYNHKNEFKFINKILLSLKEIRQC